MDAISKYFAWWLKDRFTYKGDLYTVSSEGGNAIKLPFTKRTITILFGAKMVIRLLLHQTATATFDVFLMDAAGGPAARLTYHSNDEIPFDFSSDGSKVVFGTTRLDIRFT